MVKLVQLTMPILIVILKDVKDDEENPEHEVIKTMTQNLFAKLDALSNFTYTPKQVNNYSSYLLRPHFYLRVLSSLN